MSNLQQSQETEAMLRESWIGTLYASKRLSSYGDTGKALAALIKAQGAEWPTLGGNLWLHGPKSWEVALTFSGALAVRGSSVKALHISRLADILDNFDTASLGLVEDAALVCLQGVYDASYDTCPFEPRTLYRLEAFFQNRVAMELSTVISATSDVSLADWWGEPFRSLIEDHYTRHETTI